MNIGLLITLIGCALVFLAIIIRKVSKWFSFKEGISPIMVGIGLISVPIGLVIGVIIEKMG
jgi:hypothetical protein